MNSQPSLIPVIDIGPLRRASSERRGVAREIERACRASGFFYVVGHGVDRDLQERLETLSRRFFSRELVKKLAIRMERGGRAWRGYFPLGGELTSGRPDQKKAEVRPIDLSRAIADDREERWDQASVHEFRGTYGEYLLGKVSKVFPQLRRNVL